METKYLTDGRKVVVVGQLNNVESIVQEVFVTATGDEIPSGERFTAKSLHDTPVVSYRQKEADEWDAKATMLKGQVEGLHKEIKNTKEHLKAIKEVLVQSGKIEKCFGEDDVERIAQFMTGQIEYLVVEDYEITPPVTMLDKIVYWETSYGERKYDSIKLCSILGSSNGQLSYGINAYRDGSGTYVNVYPCTSLEEAKDRIRSRAEGMIERDRMNERSWQVCKDLAIYFSDKHLRQYAAFINRSKENRKQTIIEQIAKLTADLDNI